MGDMGDIFNAMKDWTRARKRERLAEADPSGWVQHTDHHWSRQLLGSKLDYWPSTARFQWRGRVMSGDVGDFIKARERG
jgi:hypothetical protein